MQPVAGKTRIEKSHKVKNIKIYNEFETKQQFYKLAKENRKIYQNEGEAKFLEQCTKLKVTPLPAFCISENTKIKKSLVSCTHGTKNT